MMVGKIQILAKAFIYKVRIQLASRLKHMPALLLMKKIQSINSYPCLNHIILMDTNILKDDGTASTGRG